MDNDIHPGEVVGNDQGGEIDFTLVSARIIRITDIGERDFGGTYVRWPHPDTE